jgi:hypothetical protein
MTKTLGFALPIPGILRQRERILLIGTPLFYAQSVEINSICCLSG